MALPAVDCDKAFAMQLVLEDSLLSTETVYFQVALLYPPSVLNLGLFCSLFLDIVLFSFVPHVRAIVFGLNVSHWGTSFCFHFLCAGKP